MGKNVFEEKLFKGVLGLQHLIAMFGATVLVPFLTGLDPSVALFSAGVGTLIFHFCTKWKVPVFLGSSFAFIPVIIVVKNTYGDLRYAQGGMFIAGLLYVIASLLIKKIGVNRIRKILPAQVVGPMIIVIGLNLIPTAYNMASTNFIISATTLGVTLCITIFGRGFIKQVAILFGVIVGYVVSYFIGVIDSTAISQAAIISMPAFTLPKFNIGAILVIAPVVLAVFMEHVGDITTNGQVVGKNFIEDPGLNRTFLGDGIATMFASLIGGPANTTYGENTGVLAITKNYDPSILRITAVFAIILSYIGKFGAAIRTVPQAVMGGISLILFSMIALIGIKTIRNDNIKINFKNLLIIVVIIFLGVGGPIFESKFNITLGIKLTESISFSGLSFAAIVGVVLNLILNGLRTQSNK